MKGYTLALEFANEEVFFYEIDGGCYDEAFACCADRLLEAERSSKIGPAVRAMLLVHGAPLDLDGLRSAAGQLEKSERAELARLLAKYGTPAGGRE